MKRKRPPRELQTLAPPHGLRPPGNTITREREIRGKVLPPSSLLPPIVVKVTASDLYYRLHPTHFQNGMETVHINDAWPPRVAWGQASRLLACCPRPERPALASTLGDTKCSGQVEESCPSRVEGHVFLQFANTNI